MRDVAHHRDDKALFQTFAQKMADAVTIGLQMDGGRACNCPLGYLVGVLEPFATTASTVLNLKARWGISIDNLQQFINGFENYRVIFEPSNPYYVLGQQYRALYRERRYRHKGEADRWLGVQDLILAKFQTTVPWLNLHLR